MAVIVYHNIAHKVLLKQTKCFSKFSHILLNRAHREEAELSKQSSYKHPVKVHYYTKNSKEQYHASHPETKFGDTY